MSLLKAILIVVFLQKVAAGTIEAFQDQPYAEVLQNETELARSVEDKMKELRIEMVKLQILSKLNLREAPPSGEYTESSKKAVRMLLEAEDQESRFYPQFHEKMKDERLIIHSRHNSKRCIEINETCCKAFSFDLNVKSNLSEAELWVYKMQGRALKPFLLHVFFSRSKESVRQGEFSFELHKIGWNKFKLPRILLPTSWIKDFTYTVEITDQTIEHSGEYRPFLVVSKCPNVPSRKTREISCNVNTSCCLQPLRVSFAEIGFNWVLYPADLEANMCSGKCRMDHGTMNTHYERAISKVLETDNHLHESLGECWTLCCKPKQLEAVRVIYNDTDGIIHDQYIPELIVKSCSCS